MIKKSIIQKFIGLALLVGLVAPLGACNKAQETPAPEGTTTETPAPTSTETPAPTETKAP